MLSRRDLLAHVPRAGLGLAWMDALAAPAWSAPADARPMDVEFVSVKASDGVGSIGVYYRPREGNPRTAVIVMHPRSSNLQTFLAPHLTAAGYAVLGCGSRWLNNDINSVQEATLLDVAAGIRFLKAHYGVQRIVAFGHSGGGGLYAFYQAQATTPPPGRFTSTPAGDPPDLNDHDLPPVDGMIVSCAHKGEGRICQDWLDPSVVDEDDPLATDARLDMYDERNGYRRPPQTSTYTPEFLARYRAAQLERAKRLDAKAYALIARQQQAAARVRDEGFARLTTAERAEIRRRASCEEYMVVYRTGADPKMADLSLDPSDRPVGFFAWTDPEQGNYAGGGLSRVMTARGYLSTWSGPSSRMVTDENLARITVPTLVMGATADNSVTGLEAIRSSFGLSAAKDKELKWVKGGNHGYQPVEPAAGGRDTQAEAARIVAEWLRPRFPA